MISVVVLDLDGVILKTNLIKYRAMLSLFAQYPDQRERISDYILARGGVPRRDKFATAQACPTREHAVANRTYDSF